MIRVEWWQDQYCPWFLFLHSVSLIFISIIKYSYPNMVNIFYDHFSYNTYKKIYLVYCLSSIQYLWYFFSSTILSKIPFIKSFARLINVSDRSLLMEKINFVNDFWSNIKCRWNILYQTLIKVFKQNQCE